MATVYLSFTAEGQGSWERVSFPGIVGGGWLLPGSGERPAQAVFSVQNTCLEGGFVGSPQVPCLSGRGCIGRMTFSCPV